MTTPPATVPVRFDDAVASRLAIALDDLVAELVRFSRLADLNATIAGQDWAGYSRRWFDGQIDDLLTDARSTVGLAAEEADAVHRARAWAAAEQQRRIDEAIAAAAAEEARLAELAELAAAGADGPAA